MRAKLAITAIIALLVIGLVTAIHTQETRYGVEQTTIEQRNILFRENKLFRRDEPSYVKPFGGFGFKGASRASFGLKGEEESFSNLATNAFRAQGRNPARYASNFYRSTRGTPTIDQAVKLSPVTGSLVARPQITTQITGVARILSQNVRELRIPRTTVFLRTRGLPLLEGSQLYEAWLIDEDTGYAQSMGLFYPKAIGRTTSLTWEFQGLANRFETIAVSVEPYPDPDPSPSGNFVLTGNLGVDEVTQ